MDFNHLFFDPVNGSQLCWYITLFSLFFYCILTSKKKIKKKKKKEKKLLKDILVVSSLMLRIETQNHYWAHLKYGRNTQKYNYQKEYYLWFWLLLYLDYDGEMEKSSFVWEFCCNINYKWNWPTGKKKP